MVNKTLLYEQHVACHARMVDFHGWLMPLHYGSQLEEHHAVRQAAGMFDVSHMTIVDLQGSKTREFLRIVLANDVAKLRAPGQALYAVMLNDSAGVIDDLIVYWLADDKFRLVVNAATREKDLAWLRHQAIPYQVAIQQRDDLVLLAVQGPESIAKVVELLTPSQRQAVAGMKSFHCVEREGWFIATTGYTGEAGYEIMLPLSEAVPLWQSLLALGVRPCGLGARDTLRIEAGLNLYGQEMDESVSPLAANLGWTIAWEPAERYFIGRNAAERQKTEVTEQLVGLILQEKGVLRRGAVVHCTDQQGESREGVITSGTYSPSLDCGIALARIPMGVKAEATVSLRHGECAVKITKPVFVRFGRAV